MDAQLCYRPFSDCRCADRDSARHLRCHCEGRGRRLKRGCSFGLLSSPDRIEAITTIDGSLSPSPAPRVLAIVEDDPDMRLLIRVTLEEGQMEIVGEADNADEAIRLTQELQPSLVILDHIIEGSVMGLEAARFIKEACPSAKILMFSAHPISMEASQDSAIDAFVSKADFDSLAPTARGLLALP